ncbi:MAG: hypothetical protein ACRD1T_03055 [Acidimicrobiia bacterium]
MNLFVASSDVSTLIQTDSGKVVVEMTVDRVFFGFSKGRSLGFRLS